MSDYPHLSTTFEELTFRYHNGLEMRDPQRNVFEIVAPEGKAVHSQLARVFIEAPHFLKALEEILEIGRTYSGDCAVFKMRIVAKNAIDKLNRI